jgi:hypothetical protein
MPIPGIVAPTYPRPVVSTARSRAVLGVPLRDVVLAGVVVALSVGGLTSGDVDETPLALTVPVAVVIGLSLLGRNRVPLVAAVVATAANVVQGVWGNQSPGTLMALVVVLLLAYSLGAEYDESVASLGLGFMLAGMFLTEWLDGGSDYPFIAVERGGAWCWGEPPGRGGRGPRMPSSTNETSPTWPPPTSARGSPASCTTSSPTA